MREDRILKQLEIQNDRFDKQFELMNGRFGVMETKFGAMETKFDVMETKFGAMDTRQDSLFAKVEAIEVYMMENLATKFELYEVENRLTNHIDGLYKKTETLDHETSANRAHSERLDGRVTNVERHIGIA